MGKLILSESAVVELNGKKITLKEGSAIKINRNTSLFKIDNKFQIDTTEGKILVESGDCIKIGGKHKVTTSSEFISDGKKFVLENGDSFDVIEEGFFGEIKRGFLGQDPEAQVLGSMIDKLTYLTKKIYYKTGKWFEKQGFKDWATKKPDIESPYDRLLKSEEFRVLKDITIMRNNGEDTNEILDGLDKEDFKVISNPAETIKRIRDELIRIGDKRLAQVAEDIVSTGILSKANRVMKNLLGDKMAKGSLTTPRDKSANNSSEIRKKNRIGAKQDRTKAKVEKSTKKKQRIAAGQRKRQIAGQSSPQIETPRQRKVGSL